MVDLAELPTTTREAIAAGKSLQSSSFVEHAVEAIDNARSAVWRNPVDPIRKGIKHLRKAVKSSEEERQGRRMEDFKFIRLTRINM